METIWNIFATLGVLFWGFETTRYWGLKRRNWLNAAITVGLGFVFLVQNTWELV